MRIPRPRTPIPRDEGSGANLALSAHAHAASARATYIQRESPAAPEAGSMVAISLTGINWLAVIATGIVSWVIGGCWYSPPVFGKRWMALLGMKVEGGMPEGAGKALAGGLVLAIFTSLILVLFVYGLKAVGLVEGAEVGFLVWLGFVLTHGVTNVMFERRPPALFGITQAELLITYTVIGIILAVWR